MQLNIYIPKEKASVMQALDEAARRTGRPMNELAIAALEAYLDQSAPELGRFHLGDVTVPQRGDRHLQRV